MPGEVWSAIGVIVAAVLAYFGGRHTARVSLKAATVAAEVEEQTAAAASRQVDVAEWQAILAEYRADRIEMRRQLDELTARVAVLERRYLAAIRYARVVVRWARDTRSRVYDFARAHGLEPPELPPHPAAPEVIAEEF